MITKEQAAEIVRLFHAEKWKIGTIATQLGIHHGTVRRTLSREGVAAPSRVHKPYLTVSTRDPSKGEGRSCASLRSRETRAQ